MEKIGDKFGKLTFLGETKCGNGRGLLGKFKCDCGKTIWTFMGNVRTGNTKSCGCLRKHQHHGDTIDYKQSILYRIWHHMKDNVRDQPTTMLDDWNSYTAFKKFALENGFNEETGVVKFVRNDKSKGFFPDNVRFGSVPNRNQTFLTHNGLTMNMTQWAKYLGMSKQVLSARIHISEMSVEEALTKPIVKYGKHQED